MPPPLIAGNGGLFPALPCAAIAVMAVASSFSEQLQEVLNGKLGLLEYAAENSPWQFESVVPRHRDSQMRLFGMP
jgi:hypothetical protein